LDNHLVHVGILGMHWGQHKSSDGIPDSTHRLAKKDAQRHIDAKMFYGKTAGTKRKLLKAEIDKKMKTIPGYEQSFSTHLQNIDIARSAKNATATRNRIDTIQNGRSLVKKTLGVTGSLTVAAAAMAYRANKPAVDSFVIKQASRLITTLKYIH
jgi:hypothetical protein